MGDIQWKGASVCIDTAPNSQQAPKTWPTPLFTTGPNAHEIEHQIGDREAGLVATRLRFVDIGQTRHKSEPRCDGVSSSPKARRPSHRSHVRRHGVYICIHLSIRVSAIDCTCMGKYAHVCGSVHVYCCVVLGLRQRAGLQRGPAARVTSRGRFVDVTSFAGPLWRFRLSPMTIRHFAPGDAGSTRGQLAC